jgi:Rps23 Pro-64 3,4-dihydroxylase Tpa1-like proline 4-hydroxylase
MLSVNPADLPLYRDAFQRKGRLVIDNLFEEPFANRIAEFLKTMPEDWWFASTWPNKHLQEEIELHRSAKVNQFYIDRARNAAVHSLDYNQFSYSFYRTTNDHHDACACLYCETARFIKSPAFLDFLNHITGLELTTVNECFANRYSGGSWLSTHTDDVNGRLAFVYHLTKNWNTSWGGLYVAHNPDGTLSAMPPVFNRLAIFSVGSSQTPHCVTPILPGLSQSRYSITGWIK